MTTPDPLSLLLETFFMLAGLFTVIAVFYFFGKYRAFEKNPKAIQLSVLCSTLYSLEEETPQEYWYRVHTTLQKTVKTRKWMGK